MSSLEESIFLLERTFDRFSNFLENQLSEKHFIEEELESKEREKAYFKRYRQATLERLRSIEKVLREEIRLDLVHDESERMPHRKRGNSGVNILMLDEESRYE